jgi:hypothetical protein
MKVISKKGSKKILKNYVYEADYFNNDPLSVKSTKNDKYFYGKIHLKDIGWYTLSNFKTESGQEFPQKIYNIRVNNISNNSITDLKKGDIVVCLSDEDYAYLIKGGKYRVSDIVVEPSQYGWGYAHGKILLEGYSRWLTWSSWKFKKLSLQESRDIALSQIFDKAENFSVNFKRKFELMENREKILIETLAKSILDKNRHELSIMDWGIEKSGGHFKLTKEDFSHLMDKPLKDILEMFDNFSE